MEGRMGIIVEAFLEASVRGGGIRQHGEAANRHEGHRQSEQGRHQLKHHATPILWPPYHLGNGYINGLYYNNMAVRKGKAPVEARCRAMHDFLTRNGIDVIERPAFDRICTAGFGIGLDAIKKLVQNGEHMGFWTRDHDRHVQGMPGSLPSKLILKPQGDESAASSVYVEAAPHV